MKARSCILFVLLVFMAVGCAGGQAVGRRADYAIKEADWVREGKPVIYENKNWYPSEYIENHLDNEMERIGEFQEVPFYVERRQIKPFNRLYTKFDYHKYRLFIARKPNADDRD